jgi:hypothetical protein
MKALLASSPVSSHVLNVSRHSLEYGGFRLNAPFRHKFDEAPFLEFGKGTLGRSARNVESLGSAANGQPNLAVVSAIVAPKLSMAVGIIL